MAKMTKKVQKPAAKKTKPVAKKKTVAKVKTSPKKKVVKTTAKPVAKKKAAPLAKQETKATPVKAAGGKKKGYSAADLNYFRKLIEEKRKDILEEIEIQRDTIIDPMTREYRQDTSSYSLHMEHGTDSMEREKAYLFVAREARFLENLNFALQRIASKKYGWCKDCGNLIEKRRLEAVPHAQLCAKCKNLRGGTPQENKGA